MIKGLRLKYSGLIKVVAKLTTFKLQLVEAAKYGPDSGQRIRRSLQIEMFIYFQYVSTYASGMK